MPPRKKAGRATLRDVADLAQVSVATASRALNGGTRTVREEAREQVLAAARQLRYAPNLSAQMVKSGRSASVGLIVNDIADPFFSAIASGVIQGAKTANLTVAIAATERSDELELELVHEMRGQQHRAIIVAGSRPQEPVSDELLAELQAFEANGGTVVFISQPVVPFATVALDDFGGARALATRMVESGYRSFAVFAGDRSVRAVTDRINGFREGLEAVGVSLPEERIVESDFSRDGGYAAAREFFAGGRSDVDMVFAANDAMAVGTMTGLRDAGVEPGISVGVAGFDDLAMAQDVSPSLTTVAAGPEAIGSLALQMVLDGVSGGVVRHVRPEVVLRESTPAR